ncbi:hypothetical protein [Nocardia sp. NPDC005366]|uniref:hypothetical protein n=1 Tax=Nocardia sp. NPDC005366 TaxID=3156878 RepID=UPI0033A5FFB8
MNLTNTLRTIVEIDGTDYTLDPAIGSYAVVYTYEGIERGTYTYIEYYNDHGFAEITFEDGEEIVRTQEKLATRLTVEEMDQYIDGDRLLACKLVCL